MNSEILGNSSVTEPKIIRSNAEATGSNGNEAEPKANDHRGTGGDSLKADPHGQFSCLGVEFQTPMSQTFHLVS